eukprot:6390258-Prymnesium_polylepis.1
MSKAQGGVLHILAHSIAHLNTVMISNVTTSARACHAVGGVITVDGQGQALGVQSTAIIHESTISQVVVEANVVGTVTGGVLALVNYGEATLTKCSISHITTSMRAGAFGLTWQSVGYSAPVFGTSFSNDALKAALAHLLASTADTMVFTQHAWDSFGINDLRLDHYIRVVNLD